MSIFKTDRKVTPLVSNGVQELSIPMNQLFKLHKSAVARYLMEGDDFCVVKPNGINLEFTNGNGKQERLSASDYPNVEETLYIIINDYGKESLKGLVVMIMLPMEYE